VEETMLAPRTRRPTGSIIRYSIVLLSLSAGLLTACAQAAAPSVGQGGATPSAAASPSPTPTGLAVTLGTPSGNASPPPVVTPAATPAALPPSPTPVLPATPAATAVTPSGATPSPASSATPGGIPTGGTTITLANNGQTLTLQPGQSFLLDLGAGYNWTVSVGNPNVVSRVVGVLVIRGAQGLYEARQAGTTTLTAVGEPPCRQASPPCGAASRVFRLTIVVS
jgi:hypothetical protein